MVACIDINSGTKVWVYDAQALLADGFNRYSESPDAFYIVSRYPPQYVIAVSKSSGMELWRTPLPFADDSYTPKYSMPGSAVYCSGKVYCGFRGEPGKAPMVADGGLFIFDATTGKFLTTKLFTPPDSTVGFAAWRQMTWNNTNVPIIVYNNNSLILPSGFCIVRTDLDGNIIWRKGVGYLGHIALADAPPILFYNDRIYGHNNGSAVSTGAYAYSMDPVTGTVFWTQPTTERTSYAKTTVLTHNGYIDSTTLYKVSDPDWLIGQDLQTGVITWDSYIDAHFDPSSDGVDGGIAVQGKRVYLISSKYIYCLERAD
jgi:outer membrane protein assembly factor BamB